MANKPLSKQEQSRLYREKALARINAENEAITTLTLEQHKFIQNLAKYRHVLHSASGWQVYAADESYEKYKAIDSFFKLKPEDYNRLDFTYPKLAYNIYNNISTGKDLAKIANPTQDEVMTSCRDFLNERETINDRLESWLRNIDSKYGTHYAPSGNFRKNHSRRQFDNWMAKNIARAYRQGKFDHISDVVTNATNSVHDLYVQKTNIPNLKQITGMYKDVPFTCHMTMEGIMINTMLHTVAQDIHPSKDVSKDIETVCKQELAREPEQIEHKNTAVFISMDNVLLDLTNGLTDANGNIQLADVYQVVENPGFFKQLAPIEPMIEATRKFVKNHPEIDVCILSTAKPDDPPGVSKQKQDWLNRNLPEIAYNNRLFLNTNAKKSHVISQNPTFDCVLIDSNLNNLYDFEMAGGRTAYAMRDGQQTLSQQNICVDNNPDEIYRKLERVANVEHVPFEHNIERSRLINNNISLTD